MRIEEQVMSGMEWVERLGGWAVVLVIVRWSLIRVDKLIDSFVVAVEAFRSFEVEEKEMHQRIIRRLDENTVLLRRVAQNGGDSAA